MEYKEKNKLNFDDLISMLNEKDEVVVPKDDGRISVIEIPFNVVDSNDYSHPAVLQEIEELKNVDNKVATKNSEENWLDDNFLKLILLAPFGILWICFLIVSLLNYLARLAAI